jgi:hypothetical protein
MKVCPNCRQSYNDDTLNFCLNDGSMLSAVSSTEARTIVMDGPRVTNQMNWETPPDAQAPMWPGQTAIQRSAAPSINLPLVSLTLGIFSLLLVCCYFGVILGPAAVITGVIALNQEKRDPEKFGGHGIAVAGIVTGAVSFLIGILFLIFGIIGSIT